MMDYWRKATYDMGAGKLRSGEPGFAVEEKYRGKSWR
jgi:hypothetical protein